MTVEQRVCLGLCLGLRLAAWLLCPGLALPAWGQSASLLPNGMQQFSDANGAPYAGGTLTFYVPGTSTLKSTWADPNLVTLNPNPVVLDSAGRALVYGSGTYRQVLKDASGVLIWDQLSDQPVSAQAEQNGAYVWAGTSSGPANVYNITAIPTPQAYVNGQTFRFLAHQTNSGPSFVNANGLGQQQILEVLTTGTSATNSGDIQHNQVITVTYNSAISGFQLSSPAIAAATQQVPSGTIVPFAGVTAPSGWLLPVGQAVSRTTYSALKGALTISGSGTFASVTELDGLTSTVGMASGQALESSVCPAGTQILQVLSSTSITTSQNCSVTAASIVVFPYGDGDGSTTFNLPDLRGRVPAGIEAMGGTTSQSRLEVTTTLVTTSTSTAATAGSGAGLAAGMGVNGPNIAIGTTISAITGTSVTLSIAATGSGTNATRFSPVGDAEGVGQAGGGQSHTQTVAELVAHTHTTGASGLDASGTPNTFANGSVGAPTKPSTGSTGGGAAFNVTQPTLAVSFLIKT